LTHTLTAIAAEYRPCAVCWPEKYAAWKASKPVQGYRRGMLLNARIGKKSGQHQRERAHVRQYRVVSFSSNRDLTGRLRRSLCILFHPHEARRELLPVGVFSADTRHRLAGRAVKRAAQLERVIPSVQPTLKLISHRLTLVFVTHAARGINLVEGFSHPNADSRKLPQRRTLAVRCHLDVSLVRASLMRSRHPDDPALHARLAASCAATARRSKKPDRPAQRHLSITRT
jgi:hypothetical protein